MPYTIVDKYSPWAKMIEGLGQSIGSGLEARQKARAAQVEQALRQYEVLGRLTQSGGMTQEEGSAGARDLGNYLTKLRQPDVLVESLRPFTTPIKPEKPLTPRSLSGLYAKKVGDEWALPTAEEQGSLTLNNTLMQDGRPYDERFMKKFQRVTPSFLQVWGWGAKDDIWRQARAQVWKRYGESMPEDMLITFMGQPEFQEKFKKDVNDEAYIIRQQKIKGPTAPVKAKKEPTLPPL